MNLHHYFKNQRAYQLSQQQKADIFHRINQKRLEQSVAKQHFFSYKKISYMFMALVLVLFTFGGVMLERNGSISNIFFSSKPNNGSSVYADYVAEIIEFNGKYTITNGTKSLTSPYIHNGDNIHLHTGSEMLFTLNDESQAKIIGPATFSIVQDDNGDYTIYLTNGNFFKIFNQVADTNIAIISNDIAIHSDKNQPLDLQIAKEGEETLIKNNGGNAKLTVSTTQKGDTSTVEKTITKELVSIKNHDINVLTDVETFTNFLAKNNISETFSLTNPPEPTFLALSPATTGEEKEIDASIVDISLPDLSQILTIENTTGTVVNEDIKSDLGLGNQIKIPTPDQNEILTLTLNSFFLTNSFEAIYKASLENNTTKLTEQFKDLANKLHTLATSFEITTRAEAELSSIKSLVLELKTTLETNYYISPSQLTQLEKIANRCDYFLTFTSTTQHQS